MKGSDNSAFISSSRSSWLQIAPAAAFLSTALAHLRRAASGRGGGDPPRPAGKQPRPALQRSQSHAVGLAHSDPLRERRWRWLPPVTGSALPARSGDTCARGSGRSGVWGRPRPPARVLRPVNPTELLHASCVLSLFQPGRGGRRRARSRHAPCPRLRRRAQWDAAVRGCRALVRVVPTCRQCHCPQWILQITEVFVSRTNHMSPSPAAISVSNGRLSVWGNSN